MVKIGISIRFNKLFNSSNTSTVNALSMINWILQKNLTKPSILEEIKSALNKKDETWEEIEIIPFSDKLPSIQNQEAFNIIYGSTTFMLNAFQNSRFRAGVFYNPETFQMSHYVNQWKDYVLNSGGVLTRFGQVENISSSSAKKWFIRPNNDRKEFGGKVISFEELVRWSKQICQLSLPDLNAETEVWISEPKVIQREWRLFIVENKIISVSRYMKNGQLDENAEDVPKQMLSFVKKRIREYSLAEVYAMDIAESESNFKIIECNCFNGTGFYHHNIGKVVSAINSFVRKKLEVE